MSCRHHSGRWLLDITDEKWARSKRDGKSEEEQEEQEEQAERIEGTVAILGWRSVPDCVSSSDFES